MTQRGRIPRWVGTRAALIRLAALAVVLGAGLAASIAYMTWMPGESYDGPMPQLSEPQRKLASRLQEHVQALAEQIGPRHMEVGDSLDQARRYVTSQFEAMGYNVQEQRYEVRGQEVANVIVEVEGTQQPDQFVVVGAHYDTVRNAPGANDNASGVAALLELARAFKELEPSRTVRLVSFVNEEPPFFMTPQMGSYVYASRAQQRDDHIVAMMSMDGIGYYSEAEQSQMYPLPGIGLLYPTRGDFIGFVTRLSDAGLVREAIGTFRDQAQIASEAAALPGQIEGVSFSDHWSFWQHDYPAFLVTDTLPFRDPHYHTPLDEADRLDYQRMALVVEALQAVVEKLSGLN